MPQGWVTTARGEALNIDALKDAANLPIAKAKQTKTTVKKRDFNERKPVNMRGHMPAQGKHKPNLEVVEPERIDPESLPQKSATADDGVVETESDITGIKVKPTKTAVERAKARAAKGDPAPVEEVANETLTGILGDLADATPNAEIAAQADEAGVELEVKDKPAPRSRSRSRKTTSE